MQNIEYYHFPTEIIFGAGSLSLLSSQLEAQTAKNILLVADHGVTQLSFFDEVLATLSKNQDVTVFSEFSPNPVASEIDLFKSSMNDKVFDLIIGV